MARITVPRRPAGALGVSLLIALVLAMALAGGPARAADEGAGAQVWPLDAQHFAAAKVWALSQGAGVTVAVLDSGVDAAHPDLSVDAQEIAAQGTAQNRDLLRRSRKRAQPWCCAGSDSRLV